MQKLDESWSWFLDRNKDPPELKQGHWDIVGRICGICHNVLYSHKIKAKLFIVALKAIYTENPPTFLASTLENFQLTHGLRM